MNKGRWTRRGFLKAAGLAVTVSAMPCSRLFSAEPDKPNILFIFADDQCFDTLGALGCDEIETPNLDRLVASGVTFTHAFNQGAWGGAVCVASRTMLNTGRFLWNARAIENQLETEAQNSQLWSQQLKKAGYETYMSGKWHVKVDPKDIFDHVTNVRGGMPRQTKQGYNRPVEGVTDTWSPFDKNMGGYWEGGKHWSEVLGDDASAFLAQAGKRDKPFFMYMAFNAPHDPRQSPKEYIDKYPLDKVKVPANYLPEYPYKDAIGCGNGLRDERLAPFPRTEYAVKVNRQEYYAIITHMDTQVGRILDALEKTGKADNTYVFFSADHGLAVGHHGLIGKQNMFEDSLRVPLVVRGPGVPKNKRNDAPVYLQDIMPTTLELAKADKPEQVQFKSLLPLINGQKKESYDAIYGGYMDLQRMVRMGDYKMIYYPKIDKTLLFDIKKDPLEMQNLADETAYKDTIRKLRRRFRALQKDTGDTLEFGGTGVGQDW